MRIRPTRRALVDEQVSARVRGFPSVRCVVLAGLLTGVLGLAGAGCGGQEARNADDVLDVFAAASLTGALDELAERYHEDNPGRRIRFNYAGSSTLATQLRNGAEADVFASADEVNMRKVTDDHTVVDGPRVFAYNRLTILVAPGNPKRVTGLADLNRAGMTVATCAPEVPAGRYARESFAKAGLRFPQGSQEVDVKQVVQRVRTGEADAGIAYATDAAGKSDVDTVEIPSEQNVTARYPVAALTARGRPFVDLLMGNVGRQILTRHGFGLRPDGR